MALEVGKDYVWLVIGTNCWGKGDTLARAKTECRRSGSHAAMKRLLIYLGPPSVFVDEMGDICWKVEDGLPNHVILVERIGGETP